MVMAIDCIRKYTVQCNFHKSAYKRKWAHVHVHLFTAGNVRPTARTQQNLAMSCLQVATAAMSVTDRLPNRLHIKLSTSANLLSCPVLLALSRHKPIDFPTDST